MIQPYNYSRKFLDYTNHENWVGAKNDKAKTLANVIRSSIDAGTKYMLPPEGDVGIVIKDHRPYVELIRLPYPIITLEVPLTHWLTSKEDEHVVPTILSLIKSEDEDLGFSLVPVQFHADRTYRNTNTESWSMAKFAGVMTENDVRSWPGGDIGYVEYSIASMDEDAPTSDLEDPDKLPENDNFKEFYGRLMRIAIEFVIYANTRNIGVETIHAPPKLNKKRAKRGLKPNYDYKILSIHKTIIRTGGSGTSIGSHRNRRHMVCGHPRFLKGHDKPIWIEAYARGDESLGKIDKIYKI